MGKSAKLRAASFYCGAGGLDLGFSRAGVETVLANDLDPLAIATYRELHETELAIAADISSIDLAAAEGADVVIGGPPCQGFSVAGKMDPLDPRSRHVWKFMEIVSKIKPRAFVMENVRNLAENDRWADLRNRLMTAAELLGYESRLFLLNSAHFGVAQNRYRMFIVGIRGGAPVGDIAPTWTREPISVRQAFGELPRFGDPGNDTFCTAKITIAAKPVLRRSPYAGMLFNGAGRPLNLDRPSTTLAASMGGNRTPIIEQNLLDGGTRSWVREYHQHLSAGEAPYPFDGASPDLRRLTVEEAAAIQGFPKSMKWHGKASAQFRQIGNAVPPPMAEAVARSVTTMLESAGPRTIVPDFDENELIAESIERGQVVLEVA